MARASSRSWSNSGNFDLAAARLMMKPRLTLSKRPLELCVGKRSRGGVLKGGVGQCGSPRLPGLAERWHLGHAGKRFRNVAAFDRGTNSGQLAGNL